jgi:hypothetical protein
MASAAEGVGHGKRFGGVRNQEQRMATSRRPVESGLAHRIHSGQPGTDVE